MNVLLIYDVVVGNIVLVGMVFVSSVVYIVMLIRIRCCNVFF